MWCGHGAWGKETPGYGADRLRRKRRGRCLNTPRPAPFSSLLHRARSSLDQRHNPTRHSACAARRPIGPQNGNKPCANPNRRNPNFLTAQGQAHTVAFFVPPPPAPSGNTNSPRPDQQRMAQIQSGSPTPRAFSIRVKSSSSMPPLLPDGPPDPTNEVRLHATFTGPSRGVVQGLRPSRCVDSATVQCQCRVLRQAEGTRAGSSRIARTPLRQVERNTGNPAECR